MGQGIIAALPPNLQSNLCDDVPRTEFTDWHTLKQSSYNTRTNWKFDEGRIITPGERANANYVQRQTVTAARWQTIQKDFEERWQRLEDDAAGQRRAKVRFDQIKVNRLSGSKLELVTTEIPVYHLDQTQPGNFRKRTRAIIEFGKVFWRPSNSRNYIKRNRQPDRYPAKWFTKDFEKRDFEFEPFEFFTERNLLEHLNHRNIYGVKADPLKFQWWMGADLDLHIEKGGDPAIFMRQVKAILTHLQGKGWIVCLGMDVVNGIHVIKLLDHPKSLDAVRGEMRDILGKIADSYPELELAAVGAGMKPIKDAEVFPSSTQGFRLPLGIGYTALTSKPLTLVKYHTYKGVPLIGADVVGLMMWDGTEMSLEEKLDYIRQRVPQSCGDLNARAKKSARAFAATRRKEDAALVNEINDKKLLGPMKSRFRKVLVDFYTGQMQVPKSLQTGILLGANALWAQEFPLEDRTDYLLELLQQIEITEPTFSSRMSNGDWASIEYDIEHVVGSVERLRADPTNKQIEKSNDILRRWATAMKRAGFVFGDQTTWNRCWEELLSPAARGVFTASDLTDEDLDIIANHVAPVMVCSVDVAVEAVVKMIRLAHVKDRAGDGMCQEYRRAVLIDLGIASQENRKLAACWDVVEEAGFIYQKFGHIFTNDRVGRARTYAVGPRVKERVIGLNRIREMQVPCWLDDALTEGVLLSCPSRVQQEFVVNPAWESWNRAWLSRASLCIQTYPHTHT